MKVIDRLLRTFVILAVAAGCLPVALLSQVSVGQTPQTDLAAVSSIVKIEFRDVNSMTGIMKIQIDLELAANSNATVTEVDLRDFHIDGVLLVSQPSFDSFELKAKQSVLKQLAFTAPITPQMAPLVQKFGQRVRTDGALAVTAQSHGILSGKKTIASSITFAGETLLVTPDEAVRGALAKIPLFTNDTKDQADKGAKDTRKNDRIPYNDSDFPEVLKADWVQRAASNVVVIESSADTKLGPVNMKSLLYRHGYRRSDTEIIAPLDLLEPVKHQPKREVAGLNVEVQGLASSMPSGLPTFRAWLSGAHAPSDPVAISSALAAFPLRLKCKLPVGEGGRQDLGIFEFTSVAPVSYEPTNLDNAGGSAVAAIEIAYNGISDTQLFSTANLTATQVSGAVSGSSYFMTAPAVSGSASVRAGSPVFSRRGLLGIVNGGDSAVTIAEINRAMQGAGCTGAEPQPPPTPQPKPVPVVKATFQVKVWSNPGGASVFVDDEPALDESGRAVITAAGKDDIPAANTAVVKAGKHTVTFFRVGYEKFSGAVTVDDDMTLGTTLKVEKKK